MVVAYCVTCARIVHLAEKEGETCYCPVCSSPLFQVKGEAPSPDVG